MVTRSKGFALISVVMILSMLLGACATKEVVKTVEVQSTVQVEKTVEVKSTVEVEKTVVVQVTPTPVPSTRTGAWVDSLIFTEQNSAEAAVAQLKAGEIDIYAYGVNNPNVYKTVQESKDLAYSNSFGSADEITFNTAVFSDTTKLNPFTNPKIREAVNYIIDRNYVVQEIFGGLATPKLFAVVSAFPDYARYIETARKLEGKYAFNLDKGKEIIKTEMEGMGATMGADGKWQFQGAPVSLYFIIRTEDERKQIGDYVASQLEACGFTVDRQYKTRSEASPLWVRSDPHEGKWGVYTGGWITTAVSRDDGSNFSFYYTPRDYPIPLWLSYKPSAEFDAVALKLRNNDFKTMDERAQLFSQALEMSVQDSARVWVVDTKSFSPRRANLQVAYDLASGIAGSSMYPQTIRWQGQEGGAVKIAQPGIMVDPWNPIGGSNWIYDSMPQRATLDAAVKADPYTGLNWPQRIEKAEVVAQEGLPIAKTLDWVDLKFEKEITVPADAWADWDAVNQKFITVGEKYTQTVTAKTKVTVYYPKGMFNTIKWHDGSNLSMGDFIMGMITTFDYGKEGSKNYDESLAESLAAFQAHFKGVKIISTDPLVIETYDDLYALDAELNVNAISTWWPNYTYGPGSWDNIALGARADADKKLAFTATKADADKIEWMSYIGGPSLDILASYLITSTNEAYIPFAPTMSTYVTTDEAKTRWDNLSKWYADKHHFWIGTGPFYLYKAFPVEKTMMLQRFVDYPDPANKWERFGAPKIAVAELDGPGQVKIGSEAKFDVFVTYNDQPYSAADISQVKYLVFNDKGDVIATGDATPVKDGQYAVTLSADVTKLLEAGAAKLEVAVSPSVVSVPTFVTYEFVAVQ